MTEVSFEELGESPINEFLAKHFGDRQFRSFQLAGDASARRYYRVVHKNQSWVLMAWEPFSQTDDYPFLNILKNWHSRHVPVPEAVAIAPDLGLVLLEDLGDLTLERKFWENQNQELITPYYRQTLEELSLIHFGSSAEKSVAEKTEFNTEKFLWECNYAMKYFLVGLCGISFSSTEEKELQNTFLTICQTLHEQPKVVCHRDLHSRNLMLKFGKVYFIDFQDARMGPVQYDLVSLLKDSYVDLSAEIQDQLLHWYFEEFVTKNLSVSIEDFLHTYQLQTVQRCFKACGSFASFYQLRGDTRYLKYLPKTVAAVQESLKALPEHSFFSEILEKHQLDQKNYEVS